VVVGAENFISLYAIFSPTYLPTGVASIERPTVHQEVEMSRGAEIAVTGTSGDRQTIRTELFLDFADCRLGR
jgi:hypothetical protein